MGKKYQLISLFFYSVIFVIMAILVSRIPHFIYYLILNKKIQISYYKISSDVNIQNRLLPGSILDLSEGDESTFFENENWMNFHIVNYIIPIPLDHPGLVPFPIINDLGKEVAPIIEIHFQNKLKEFILSWSASRPSRFPKYFGKQKFFQIPLIKNQLEEILRETIWRDLFTLNLGELKLKEIIFVSYKELLYRLYILQARLEFFSKDAEKWFFVEKYQRGGVQLPMEEKEGYKKEIWMGLRGGPIEMFNLVYRHDHPAGKLLRRRMVAQVQFSPANFNLTDSIYKMYKGLPYKEKNSLKGQLLLFSAFTQNTADDIYLKEFIGLTDQFDLNYPTLQNFYNYALKRLGKDDETLEKLNKKISEEEEEALKKIRNTEISTEVDESKLTKEERLKMILKKSKEIMEENKQTKNVIEGNSGVKKNLEAEAEAVAPIENIENKKSENVSEDKNQ
jgi:hypothetical protein